MGDMRARVAYVKGLLSGLGTDGASKEARLVQEIIRVLGEFAEEIEELKSAQKDAEDYIRALDEDLYTVETAIFGEEEMPADLEGESVGTEGPGERMPLRPAEAEALRVDAADIL